MSDVLTYFREQVDPRFKDVSDSDLTEFIYNRYPEFSKDSGFQSSVQRLFAQQAQFGTSAPDFVSDDASQRGRLSSSGQSIMRGGGVGTGGAISLFGRVMNTLAPYVAAGSDNPQARMYGFEEMQRRGTMSPEQREAEIQQDPIYQAGKAISSGATEAFQPNPKYRGEFFTDVLPSSLGGMVPTVAAGMVNPWLGVAQYAGSSGEDIAQEAIAAGRPDLANKAAFIGAPIGALTEGLLGQASKLGGRMIVSRLATGGTEAGAEALAREAAKPLGRAMAETAIKEAAQEGLEQLGQNISARNIVGYDPNRPVMQGVGESMLAGGILGVGGEAAVRGVNRSARAEYNRAVDRAFAEEDRRLSPYIERLANQYIDDNPEVGRRMFVDPSRQEIIRSPMPEIAPGITAGTGAAFNQEAPYSSGFSRQQLESGIFDYGDAKYSPVASSPVDQIVFNNRLQQQSRTANKPLGQLTVEQLQSGLLSSSTEDAGGSPVEQFVAQSRQQAASDQLKAAADLLAGQQARLNPEAQSQFGPGARPAPAPATRAFQPSQSIMDRLRAARQADQAAIDAANAARAQAAAEAQAKDQAEAEAAAAASAKAAQEAAAQNLQPMVSLPTGPGAAAVGGVPAAAPAISQAPAAKKAAPQIEAADLKEVETLKAFMDDVELENINAPSPAKMRSLANKALKLGYIDRASLDEINRVQKSMGSREDTTDAMNELMGRLVLRLEGLQNKAAPAPVSPVTQPKKSNANQKQGRVEVPRGEQPQGAPQDAAGQPGAVQVPAGESVKAVTQAAPQVAPQGDVAKAQAKKAGKAKAAKAKPAPVTDKYADGTPIELGNYVKLEPAAFGELRPAIGKTYITGRVAIDEDTGKRVVVIDKVGKGGSNSATMANIVPGRKQPILDGSALVRLEEPKAEPVKEKKPRSTDLTPEQMIAANEMISAAMDDPRYDDFKSEIAALYRSSEKSSQELDAIRKELGPNLSLAMEAAFNREIGPLIVAKAAEGLGISKLKLDEAQAKFDRSVLNWFIENIALPEGERVRFAGGNTASMQVDNAKRLKEEDKRRVTPTDTEQSSRLAEGIAANSNDAGIESSSTSDLASSSSGSSLDKLFGSLKKAADIIIPEIASFEKLNGGEKLERNQRDFAQIDRYRISGGLKDVSLEGAIYSALRKNASDKPEFKKDVEKAEMSLMDNAERIADEIFNEYSEGTLQNVREMILDGGVILRADNANVDTGNQSLTEGTTMLRDAISTVLAEEKPGSPLRKLADALLRAGVNPDVVVLSDEAFNALRPGLEGQTAFYDADPASNTVYIRQSAASHDYLVMHEAVHAATVYAIRTNGKFRFELAKLRTDAMNALGAGSFYGLQEHGSNFKNLAEFVGEALSSQQFREALDGIKTASGQSLWARFKQMLANLFGLKGSQRSLLDAVTELSMQHFAQNVAGGEAGALFGQSEGVQPLTSAADAAYLDLANRYDSGDQSVLPELQQMVDDAAKAAGYGVGPVYHGRLSEFTVFSKDIRRNVKSTAGDFFYFTGSKKLAELYKTIAERSGRFGDRGNVLTAHLSVDNPLSIHALTKDQVYALIGMINKIRRAGASEYSVETDTDSGISFRSASRNSGSITFIINDDDSTYSMSADMERLENALGVRMSEVVSGLGYDGVTFPAEEGESVIYGVISPSQIKSADPITRDSSGNIIPLSQRFNPNSDSILFASTPVNAGQLAERIKLTDSEGQAVLNTIASTVVGLVPSNVIESATRAIIPDQVAAYIDAIESEPDTGKRNDLIRSLKQSGQFDYRAWQESPENKASRAVAFMRDASEMAEQGLRLSAMPTSTDEEVKLQREAAASVFDFSERIRAFRDSTYASLNKLKEAAANKLDELNKRREELSKYTGTIASSPKAASDAYKAAINAAVELSKLRGLSLGDVSRRMAMRMARVGSQVEEINADIQKIARNIDKDLLNNPDVTNEEIVNHIIYNRLISGSPIESEMLPTVSKSGNVTKKGYLLGYKGLVPMLRWVANMQQKMDAAQAVIDNYNAQIAKSTKTKEQPVTLDRFLREYSDLVRHYDEVEKNNRLIERRDNKIKSLDLQLKYANSVMNSPEYKAQSMDSVKIGDRIISGMRGATINERGLIIYTVGKRADGTDDTFEINQFTNTEAGTRANQETYIRLINKIQSELGREDITPVYRNTMYHMLSDALLMNDERIESTLWYNNIDPLTHLRRLPGVRMLVPSGFADWLAQGRIGVELGTLSTALDNIKRKIRALHSNERYGRNAQLIAAKAAIDSHAKDMPPNMTDWEKVQWWEENVLSEVFDQNQDTKENSLRPGQNTTGNVEVTKEDYRAAELMARWQDKLRQIIESTKGAADFQPTRIRETRYEIDKNGEKKEVVIERLAFAEGSLTTPVLMDRSYTSDHSGSSPIDLSSRWKAIRENDTEGKLKLLSDPKAYKRLALRHVADLSRWSSVRKSKFDEAYRGLAMKWRNNKSTPGNIEDLIDEITDAVPTFTSENGGDESDAEKRARVTSQLFGEITKFTEDHATQLNEDSASITADPLFNMVVGKSDRGDVNVMTFLDGENSFMKPRRNAVAPPSFYSHSLLSNEAFMGLEHGATLPLEVRRYKLLDELLGRLAAAKNELDKKISEEKSAKRGEKSTLSKSTADLVRSMTKGDPASVGYNYTSYQLGQMIKTISAIKESVRGSLAVRPSIVESRGFVNRALGLVKLQWLSTFKSLIKQGVEAVIGTRMVGELLFKGTRFVGPHKVGAHSVKTVMDLAKSLYPNNPEVADFLKRNSGKLSAILNEIAKGDADMIRAKAFIGLDDGGLAQELQVLKMGNDMFSRNLPSKNVAARALDSLLSKWGMRHVEGTLKTLVQEQEKIANILSTVYYDRMMTEYMRKLAKLIEVRIAKGDPALLDFSKPENNFTSKELATVGIDASTWAKQLKVLRSSQKLEQMALDFYKRHEAAKAAGEDTSKLAFTSDEGVYEDIITNLSKLNNLALATNRPETIAARTELGDLARAGTVFVGWASGFSNTLQLLQMARNDKPMVRKLAFDLATMLRMAQVLAMFGLPLVLLRSILYRIFDNRPYPAETVMDFARNPSSQLGLRVAATAIGSGIPLIGDDIAGMLGAQNVKSSFGNLLESSLVGKSVKSLLDAATTYVKTGDTAGSALALQRTFAPALTPVVNRLPDVEARNAINDAVRVAKVNRGEIEVKERGGGQGAQPTEFSSLVNKAVAASAAGDMAGAMKYREQAIAVKTAAGDKDADGAFRAAVAARNPEFKAFGRRLSDSEREAVLGRMSEDQRAIYDRADKAVSNLLGAIPKATRAVSGSGNGTPAAGGIAAINRKFRQLKNRTTPPALKAVKKKLASLKPKKLSLGGVRGASAPGSRLLRPKALGRAGAVRLPGVSRRLMAPAFA